MSTTTTTMTAGSTAPIELRAEELVDDLEDIVHEGLVRRIIVKKDGDVVAEFPLAVGVAGAVVAAPFAAIAAIVALISDCTIEVVRTEPADAAPAAEATTITPSTTPSPVV